MRSIQASIVLVLAALLSGCGNLVDVTKTSRDVFTATRADDVDILTVVPREKRFEEIATISTSRWSASNTAKMHNALREKAAPLGANAVIISNSGIDYNNFLWSTGTAIRYK